MKKIMVITLLLVPTFIFSQDVKEIEKLDNQTGIYIIKATGKVFSGKMKTIYSNGETESLTNIENGIKKGKIEMFYDSGLPMAELCENEQHQNYGAVIQWNENGSVAFSGHYIEGKLFEKLEKKPYTGIITTKYSEGNLHAIANFKDGLWHGTQTRFNRDGTVVSECIFEMNEIVDCPVYSNKAD